LMAGLMLGLLSMLVVLSAATPLQGSPLMFQADDARRPHLPRIVFSAATASHHNGAMHAFNETRRKNLTARAKYHLVNLAGYVYRSENKQICNKKEYGQHKTFGDQKPY
jgi:hypothetical protein